MSIIVPYLPRIYHFFFSKRRQRATGSRRCTKSAVHGKVGHVPRRRHAFHRPYLNTRTYVSGRRPREDEAERVGDSRVLGERGNSKKMLLRLLAAAAGRAKTPGVNSARRERKKKKGNESERENRKNATGRKYVEEDSVAPWRSADCPLSAPCLAAFAHWKMSKWNGWHRYHPPVPPGRPCLSVGTEMTLARAAAPGDRKNLPKFADKNHVLSVDLRPADTTSKPSCSPRVYSPHNTRERTSNPPRNR